MVPTKRERIKASEAALILGLPHRTVLGFAAQGRLPGAAKLGRSWTFDEAKLRAWVKGQEDQVQRRALALDAGMSAQARYDTIMRRSREAGEIADKMRVEGKSRTEIRKAMNQHMQPDGPGPTDTFLREKSREIREQIKRDRWK